MHNMTASMKRRIRLKDMSGKLRFIYKKGH